MTTKSRPKVTKKIASAKPAPKAAAKTAAKKSPVKKTVAKAAPKAAPKKKAAEEAAPRKGRELNEHGFIDGTDSAIIAQTLTDGGVDRNDINDLCVANISKVNGIMNRNGQEKYIPSMVSGILGRMVATGEYAVESSWQLVKIEKPAKKVVRKTRAKK